MPRAAYATDLTDAEWDILKPLVPAAKAGRPPRPARAPGTRQRDPVRAAHRVPVAAPAARPAAVGHGLVVVPTLAPGRDVGGDQHGVARAGAGAPRAGAHPQRGQRGPPIGQDDRNRGVRGYDGGKHVTGRKRHLFVDTEGFVLTARVHPANETEAAGAKGLLAGLAERFPRMKLLWVDAGYKSGFATWVTEQLGWTVETVKHPESGSKGVWVAPGQEPPAPPKGFRLLKRRWVVERTFAWLGRNRRLSKDDEELAETGETWLLRRLARP